MISLNFPNPGVHSIKEIQEEILEGKAIGIYHFVFSIKKQTFHYEL